MTWHATYLARLFFLNEAGGVPVGETLQKIDADLTREGYCKVVCGVLTLSGKGESLINNLVGYLQRD